MKEPTLKSRSTILAWLAIFAAAVIFAVTGAAPVDAEQRTDNKLRLGGVKLPIVEDNPMNQVMARSLLEQAGAKADIAGDGMVALDLLGAENTAMTWS